MMKASIAYAKPAEQAWRDVTVPEGSSVRDLIDASGILNEFPEINLAKNKVGIFGEIVALDHKLEDGDRVEIYRPILIVPENLQKRKYRLRKLAPTVETAKGIRQV